MISNEFVTRFNLSGPLVVAPLGGGPTTVDLVVATCEAGALGSLAAAYLSSQQIDDAVAEIKKRTQRAYAINLFAPMPSLSISEEEMRSAVEATKKFRMQLNLPEPVLKPPFHPNFDQQFESVLRAKPKVFSFVFGNLDKKYFDECKKAGIYTIGTATKLEEALALQDSGVDAIAAQGVEAGGHRGSFNPEDEDSGIGALELTRLLSPKIRIPIITAGGVMDGAGIFEAIKAGASAAMLGTAFLLCPEAGTSKPYRSALLEKNRTHLTRAFSGRIARGLENIFMLEVGQHPEFILPFPAQNAFTRDIRNKATATDQAEYLSLWSGTGVRKIRQMNAYDLVKTLFQEFESKQLHAGNT